jgi:hypothetical protein
VGIAVNRGVSESSSAKPLPETIERFTAAHRKLARKLGRPPTSTQLATELNMSPQRARELLSTLGLPRYKTSIQPTRADTSTPIPTELDACSRRLVTNLRRLYERELAKKTPRLDGQLAHAAGIGADSRPDQAATVFRAYIVGSKIPNFATAGRIAVAFGTDYSDLLRKPR